MCSRAMRARRWPTAPMLRGSRCRIALLARRATFFARQRDADQALDIAQVAELLAACDERDRDTFGASARGAADAMHICLGHVGQIEIYDVADAIDIDAACGDVSRDQRADLAGAECRQHALTMVLRLVAMDGIGGDPSLFQAFHHLVRAMLGPG